MSYALITGGSKGIGKEIAKLLAAKGYNLLLVARSENELATAKTELEAAYKVSVDILSADLSLDGAAHKVKDWATEGGRQISILINNAGYGLWGMFEKQPMEFYHNMMKVNMQTLVDLSYLMLPVLKQNPKAYIMNVASTAAYQAVPSMALYAASKSFVLLFTRALRFEMKKTHPGVSVTCLSPGATATNFTNRAGMQAMQAVADKFNMDAGAVAKIAVDGMFKGKAEIIPGFTNLFTVKMIDFMPKSLIESIAANLYLKHLK